MVQYTMEEKLCGLIAELDDYINHYHGGSVSFVSYSDGIVRIRLGDACENCPLASNTVQGWVAGTIRQFFPEVTQVEAVRY